MTTFLLLFASLALVALIGAVLVYAVNRVVTWSVERVEGRDAVASAPVSAEMPGAATTVAAPAADPVESTRDAVSPSDLASTPIAPTQVVSTPAARPTSTQPKAGQSKAAQPETGPATTAA